jgi:folate-binding protein YgfZ
MWMILNYRQVLEVKGADRFTFLQGLITQDITKLVPELPLYSLFLTNTGRFFCDFFMVTEGESIFLTPGASTREVFQKKLSFYKLRNDVSVQYCPHWVVAARLPQKASSLLGGGTVFRDPRWVGLGEIFIGPSHCLKEATSDSTLYESHRLALGVPEGPLDLEPEKSIPLENWMDELNAISWSKGCFLGQELTARTKHVGEVRKKLLPFSASQAVSRGDLLFQSTGLEVGRIVNTYQNGQQGFALIRKERVPHDSKVLTAKGVACVHLRDPIFIDNLKK